MQEEVRVLGHRGLPKVFTTALDSPLRSHLVKTCRVKVGDIVSSCFSVELHTGRLELLLWAPTPGSNPSEAQNSITIYLNSC